MDVDFSIPPDFEQRPLEDVIIINGRCYVRKCSSDPSVSQSSTLVQNPLDFDPDAHRERYCGITFVAPTLAISGNHECELEPEDWSLLKSLCKLRNCDLETLASDAWGSRSTPKTVRNHLSAIRTCLTESRFPYTIPPVRGGEASIKRV